VRALLIACVLVAVPVASAAQHVLDLTKIQLPPGPSSGTGDGWSTGRSGQRPPAPPPLNVRLARVDRSAYVLGEPIVYEIVITNVGTRPFLLPWSPIRPPDCRACPSIFLNLEFEDAAGHTQGVSTTALFENPGHKDSALELRPGATATVRAPGVVNVSNIDEWVRLWKVNPRAEALRGRLSPATPGDQPWASVLSTNTIPVQLRPANVRR
jgi:hypothetical protein